jgi:hypothetical protein
MQTVTVAKLIAQLSGYPPEAPIRVSTGGVDLATHEAELVQGGWEPPFVRIVPAEPGQDAADAARPLPTTGALLLVLTGLLCFIVGFLLGRG